MTLDAWVQDGLRSGVTERGAILVEEVHQLLAQIPEQRKHVHYPEVPGNIIHLQNLLVSLFVYNGEFFKYDKAGCIIFNSDQLHYFCNVNQV